MFGWLISHTVESAALAAAAWLLCLCLRPRSAARHALWLIVLAKLLTPPLIYWPWPLPALAIVQNHAPHVERDSVTVSRADGAPKDVVTVGDEELFVAHLPVVKAADAPIAAPEPSRHDEPAVDAWAWAPMAALTVWLAGGCFMALVQLTRIVRLGRRLSRGRPADAGLAALAAYAARSLNMRPPRIILLPGAASPMVCALGGARLVWPEGLEDRLSAEGVRAVLLHELAHLRRRDHLAVWLVLAGACIWWWHPLFWLVRRRLTQEAELACDAWVTATLPEARKAYAEALLEVSKGPSAAPALVLAASSDRRDLERRLIMVMRAKAPARLSWVGLIGVGLLGLAALPALSLGGGDPPRPPVDQPVAPSATIGRAFDQVVPTGAPFAGAGQERRSEAPAPSSAAAPDDRDKKIQELEQRIRTLLKELEDLHVKTPSTAALGSTSSRGLTGSIGAPSGDLPPDPPSPPTLGSGIPVITGTPTGAASARTEPATQEVTLSRVTYKLPAGHAEATAQFLSEHVGAPVLETKADGDNLIVTTTPETQKVIRMLVALVQARPPVAAEPPLAPDIGPTPLDPPSPPRAPGGPITPPTVGDLPPSAVNPLPPSAAPPSPVPPAPALPPIGAPSARPPSP